MKTYSFIDAVRAGHANPDEIKAWISAWDEMREVEDLPIFLGITVEEYGVYLTKGQESLEYDNILRAYGIVMPKPEVNERLTITHGISADTMESSYMNATLSSIEGDRSVNVAVHPPKDLTYENAAQFNAAMQKAFEPLVSQGWIVEIQTGCDENHSEGITNITNVHGIIAKYGS